MDPHEPRPDSDATQPAGEPTQSAGARPDPPTVSSPGNTALDRLGDSLVQAMERHPDRIGGFEILGVLGKGGMGVVYEARQDRPQRNVALKVVRPGLASKEALRRFELEAQVLARLQHPRIAQVFEVGTADIGAGPQPYFAMELVRGVNLRDFAESRKLSVKQRLELMGKVCDAVQHAHQKGVIHRDLKPGNILVVEEGGTEGEASGDSSLRASVPQCIRAFPKILDFGVARVTDSDIRVTTIQTDVGQLIGTIPYMSPEQVSADPNELDTRSDVYALGVILYELLAGRLPYDVYKGSIGGSPVPIVEAVRVIREEDPTPLSSAVARVARSGDLARPCCTVRDVRGDVETIVAKALEKDKTRRYQAASALAADIRRYLAHEPIAARPPSAVYQLRKFARRNKALVGGIAAVFVVLVAGVITSTGLYLKAEARRLETETAREAEALQRKIADERRQETEQVAQFQASMFSGIDIEAMGRGMLNHMRSQVRSGLERQQVGAWPNRRKRTPQEVESALKTFDASVAPGHPVDVARRTLDEFILRRATSAINEKFSRQPLIQEKLHRALGEIYQALGLYDSAEQHYSKRLELVRLVHGPGHPDVGMALSDLGQVFRDRGEFDRAEPLLRESLALFQRVSPEDEPIIATSFNNLAALLRDKNDLAGAETCYRKALAINRRLFGEEQEEVANNLNNLGIALQDRGELAEAEPMLRQALAIRRLVHPKEHLLIANSLNTLARIQRDKGELAEAEAGLREALAINRHLLGDEHPDVLFTMNNLASLLYDRGEEKAAEPLFREAVEVQRRVLGEQHPDVAMTIANLADLLNSTGRPEEAEALNLKAIEIQRRLLGDDHPDVAQSLVNHSMIRWDLGDDAGAQSLLDEALSIFRKEYGPTHPFVGQTLNNIGALLQDQGDVAGAEAAYRESIAIGRPPGGEEMPFVASVLNNIARLRYDQRRYEEAEALFREVLLKRLQRFPSGHIGIVLTQAGLAACLGRMQRWDEAGSLAAQAHEAFSKNPEARGRIVGRILRAFEDYARDRAIAEPGKGYDSQAASWREKLKAWQATTRPSHGATKPRSDEGNAGATTQPAVSTQRPALGGSEPTTKPTGTSQPSAAGGQ